MPLLVEMGWGGLVQSPETISWTDITTRVDVNEQGVSITRGASDELSDTQPGTATLRLDNQDGALTPGNSLSPYYPYVRKLAPIRISAAVMPTVSGSAPYPMAMLGDDFDDGRVNAALWTTNTGSTGQETAEGRLRITIAPGIDTNFTSVRQWTLASSKVTAKLTTVPAANGSSNCAASMWILSTTSGTRIGWRYDALTGVLAAMSQTGFADGTPTNLTYSAIDHAWLRVRESAGTVYWETSGDGFIWTTRRTLATPAWVTSQQHALDFPTTRTGGTSGYIEWDLLGAEIRPRFWGVVNSWPVRWEGLTSQVLVTCSDMLKRLGTAPALRSVLAEEILHQDTAGVPGTLSAYYPLSEPADSTAAGDISGGGCGALTLTQIGSGGTLEFGGEGLAETGEGAPTFTPASSSAGKYLTADVGAVFEAASDAQQMILECWIKTTTVSRAILGLYSTGLDNQLALTLSASGELVLEYTDSGGTLTTLNTADVVTDGEWHHIVLDMANTNKAVYLDGALGAITLNNPPDMHGIRHLHVGGYRGSRMFSGQIAHVAVTHLPTQTTSLLITEFVDTRYAAGTTAFAGEDADVRVARLARYGGVNSVTVWGSTFDPVASQGPAGSNALARMREVETTEAATLFAERDWYGIALQSRDIRYNPSPSSEVFTIAYADLDTDEVEASDDDQKMVNIVEASRPGGATQRVTSPASILAYGEKPQQLNLLKTSDLSVMDAAAWLVSRYADPPTELREIPIEAYTMSTYLDILDADIGSYFSVTDLPSQAPASSMRNTVEGYTEVIKDTSHKIQFHTSKSATDSVWVLDDSVYSVLGSTTRLAY
ncbi:LamG-like jellyroll fold domain-containing protein [Streptomyces caniscabiei]|uniref:LamG domain-containing protein n=1 Tax=Streptomyces caniscabiei TaxID=2746961 RepID=A0ABU4MI97_9ACTN|nr:LamG-like jellyroll fold domain-containing protein [Streptomyces caniscabiei]MBE4790922.1 LamG domain-containing protein [Streptomyces caniscabiei]MDX2953350.1 LamG domain-containing protein [Streptomyces caniscabiei]MDX2987313.1 LamG domain-containing protein [Streptomyces caniscabiei]MDX3009550.1 LamG domain-containing protein [Streptomyces caniscabiei]MDX3037195.1 LamG domain-containing protein [Streptomyces caniscabiei]